jgi:hypothetical protein
MFRIHPQSEPTECSRLFGSKPSGEQLEELNKESDFKKAATRGWVRLEGFDFDKDRQFYPCFQDVAVSFPSLPAFYEFVESMDSCPQYPFYSGADYAMQTAIFEEAVVAGDHQLYKRLLGKDGRCVSELNPPLYSILRKNPQALLRAFAELNEDQRRVAVATQYDFNKPWHTQLISDVAIAGLSEDLKNVAKVFNEMMRKEAIK